MATKRYDLTKCVNNLINSVGCQHSDVHFPSIVCVCVVCAHILCMQIWVFVKWFAFVLHHFAIENVVGPPFFLPNTPLTPPQFDCGFSCLWMKNATTWWPLWRKKCCSKSLHVGIYYFRFLFSISLEFPLDFPQGLHTFQTSTYSANFSFYLFCSNTWISH